MNNIVTVQMQDSHAHLPSERPEILFRKISTFFLLLLNHL